MTEPSTLVVNDVKYIREDSIPNIELPQGEFAPFEVGQEYFIQTVTCYYLGLLVDVTESELVITNASWVADTGRFHKFINGSNPSENEPYNKSDLVILSRGALVSAVKRKIYIEVA